MVRSTKVYEGIHNDKWGGMTQQGNIIRDAWVFGVIPETETCEGWNLDRMQELYDKVHDNWAKYGMLASRLPEELAQRHARIHQEAVARARKLGWDPELGEDD